MSPGAAALKVEQPVGLHRIAEAGRQGVEPLILEVGRGSKTTERSGCERPAFTVARPIKHIADADHKSAAELVIAADLTATGKARTVSRDLLHRRC